jgi:hypothetical protein
LRGREDDVHGVGSDETSRASAQEFWEDDLSGLKG